jgi:hypothetical protein
MKNSEWNNLRTFNGSQQSAFEELCCQLASQEVSKDFQFIRKGTPDAGVECFAIAPNGSEWGWQAKFFDQLGSSQIKELDESFFTAINKHPRLVKYFVCLPIDLSDARITNRKSQLEKWETTKRKWEQKVKLLNREVEIVYWGNFEIFKRLSLENARGRYYYWFHKESFSRHWFEKHLEQSINQAGPRYTSALNVELPVAEVFDGLGRTPAFVNRAKVYARDLKRSFEKLSPQNKDFYTEQEAAEFRKHFSELLLLLNEITYSVVTVFPWEKIKALNTRILRDSESIQDRLWELDKKSHEEKKSSDTEKQNPHSLRRSAYSEENNYLHRFLLEIKKLSNYIESESVLVSNNPFLLVVGEAGKGKTHLFCDVASNRLRQEMPTVLLLGEFFDGYDEPWTQLLRLLDLRNVSVEEFLGALDASAQAHGQKALIMIDALNEGNGKQLWRNHLGRFAFAISRYSWLSLAVSVRSSYERITIPDSPEHKDLFVKVVHHGFAENEYDAVRSFFEYYHLELPSSPLLLPEFQTPLFLKILCKGLQDKGLTRIPSGYVGITETFELFISAVDEKIWREHYSSQYLKPNKLVQRVLEAFAELMSKDKKDWLTIDEAEYVINKIIRTSTNQSFLALLLSEGVLSTRMHYEADTEIEVVRFSYEKFSDHIITNYLIKEYIQQEAPRNSFLESGSLRYLIEEPWRYQGIIESLCVQIPEKLGCEFPEIVEATTGEDYIGRAFIASIIWRDVKAFNETTRQKFTDYSGKSQVLFYAAIDALLTVASNPDHPYNAKFLHSILSKYSMAERDAWWSIYLHRNYGTHNALDRLIDWAWSDQNKDHVSEEALELCGMTLTWLFTTSNRFLRDRATKALTTILTGKLHIMELILEVFKDIDDMYVLERLYACAYGCALRSKDVASIKSLAETVYRLIFRNMPPVHILLRDYAKGTIDYALSLGVELDIAIEQINPPYASDWPSIPSKEELEKYDTVTPYDSNDGKWSEGRIWHSVMHDDFARYVIGTNSSITSRHWLSFKLSDEQLKSPEEQFNEFVSSLNAQQIDAWKNYQSTRQNLYKDEIRIFRKLPNETIELLLSLSESEEIGKNNTSKEIDEINARFEKYANAVNESAERFTEVLSQEQRKVFADFVLPYQNNPQSFEKLPRFNLDEMQRWILKRVFDLGWTVERFGDFDRHDIGYNGRDAHKAERIGKKYQWIAYYEFLGYLSDHYQFRHEYKQVSIPFNGAWQLGIRDIDPSCTLRVNKNNASVDMASKSWWTPLQYDIQGVEDDDTKWLMDQNDVPDITKIIEITDPQANANWLCLDGFVKWETANPIEEERYEKPRRELWLMLKSYLVNNKDVPQISRWAAKQNFMGRWMPEAISYYHVFLGEFHWAKSYLEKYGDDDEWVGGDEMSRIPKKVLIPVEEYAHEGSGFDCSTDYGIQIKIPSGFLARKMHLKNSVDSRFYDPEGNLMAFDPSIFEYGPSTLLVKREKFIEFLEENKLSIFWTVIGEKQVLDGSWNSDNWNGRLNINGAYWLKKNKLSGKLSTTFEGNNKGN